MSIGVENQLVSQGWLKWLDGEEARFNAKLARRGLTRETYERERVIMVRLKEAQREVDCYRSKFMPAFREWKRDSGFFRRGMTTTQFMNLRESAMLGWLGERDKQWLDCFPLVADDEMVRPFLEDLLKRGVIVESEIRYVVTQLAGGHIDFENILLIKSFADYTENTPRCLGKIITIEEALLRMQQGRNRGTRVVTAWGHFDVGTKGHEIALDEFSWVTQHGDLFVFVDGDQETRVSKGDPNRPYIPQAERMRLVARHRGVKWVVPVNFDIFATREELIERFVALQNQIGGLAHIRIIGSREPKDQLYLEQTNQAGMLFLYSNRPKISSASSMGRHYTVR